jgi:DNA-directed RNA polymerase specialized sigma24 family protein
MLGVTPEAARQRLARARARLRESLEALEKVMP